MENAIIQLGDIDDSQKGRPFKSRFIQAGIAGYPKQFGNVLITKETLDKFVNTLVDKPVIINHKDEIKPEDEVGKVTKVWFNSEDGWFWCEGYLTDETAINLIKDKGWSVSCSYDVLLLDDEGGTENNIKYDKEFLNGKFTHLAIVENPRYERANIVVNSKTEVINDKWITVHPNGEDEKGRHLLIQDGEDLKEAMQRQWGVYDKRQAKLKSDIKKTTEKTKSGEEKELNKQTSGTIYQGKTWREIFEKRLEPKESKSWWIEKVNKPSESLLADDVFSHYQLKSEEGYRTKIPSELNDYIEEHFDTSEKYIYNPNKDTKEKQPEKSETEPKQEEKKAEPKVEKSETKETYYDDDMEEYYTQDYVNSIKKDFDDFMKKAKEEKKSESKETFYDEDMEEYYTPAYQENISKDFKDFMKKAEEKKEAEAKKQKESSDSPFGEGVKVVKTTRKSNFYDRDIEVTKLSKDNNSVEIDKYGDKDYHLRGYTNGQLYYTHDLTSEKGAIRKAQEFLGVVKPIERKPREKKPDAPLVKTDLNAAETKYNEVLKRYEENEHKRWQSGLSNAEYYIASAEAEKAKKELTTARREYAESIMANFEEQDNSAYTDKVDARRERFLGLSEQAQKASDAAHKRFSDMALAMPFGQPNVSARTISYRKKEGRAFDAAIREGKKADYYANKAASVGTAGISADDANAIAKLAQKYKSGVTSAEKRRIIDRVIDIHKNRQAASDTSKQTDYSNLGFQVERNADINRLQLKFDGKPDEKTRSILKSNGFRWSPREGAWQRQLNGNSEYGLKRVVEGLQKVDNSLTKGIKKIFNSYVPTAEDIPLLQGLIDIFEKNNK